VDGLFQPSRELGVLANRPHHSIITSFYMFRLWFMTFFGDYRGASAHDNHDSRAGAPCATRTRAWPRRSA